MKKNGEKCYEGNFASLLEGIGLSHEEIDRLAREAGVVKRTPRKISAHALVCLLLQESVRGTVSYNDLAARLEAAEGISVSKQAIWKRVNAPCSDLIKAVLAAAIIAKMPMGGEDLAQSCGKYGRVLVQDSTVIQLPSRLFPEFSGVSNGTSSTCNARIQATYDLLGEEFVSFSIDPYSKNDLLAAPELELREGDLSLRDRGYLVYDEIQRHVECGADCIYRHKHGNVYLDPVSGKPIDLAALLAMKNSLDMEVALNNDAKTKVRLVAVPASEETVNLRRMNARKHLRGHNPSEEYLHMLSWTIFITTIPKSEASFEQLLLIYGFRWRIEVVFKSWKSNMCFAEIHNVSSNQLKVLITARLAMIVIIGHFGYTPAARRICRCYGKVLSMMKATRYFMLNPEKILELVTALMKTTGMHPVFDALARYCTYDVRKRKNFSEEWQDFCGSYS